MNDMTIPAVKADEAPSSAALTTYDVARQAIATCVVIDDAKDIKDRAEALRQYALQKNDPERAEWLGQIACRAAIRIGEIRAAFDRVRHGIGSSSLFSRASSPIRVFRHKRDLL